MKMYQVDAFTNALFKGNPAAVIVTEQWLDEALMQNLALENNLSETAFVKVIDTENYEIRWFSPTDEVAFCGHATLASAHVLWESGATKEPLITFHTLSGNLIAKKLGNTIELNFPVEPLTAITFPEGMNEALGISPLYMGKTDVRYFAEVKSANEVRDLKPDLNKLLQFPPARVIVTARSDDPKYDFISRYFAPGIGIPEDPVTGSAHCSLALYWSERLSKTEFLAYQASHRGGELKIILEGARVRLQGDAITTMQGVMVV